MKRTLFSLMMAGGLALMAAPKANAASCDKLAKNNYAINIEGVEFFNGTQPASGAVPNAVAALGAIQIDSGCAVHGELIYDDNGTVQGPASCTPGGESMLWEPPAIPIPVPVTISGFVPCFSGTASQVSGTVALNSALQGVMTISATFASCLSSTSAGPPNYFACAPTSFTAAFKVVEGTKGASFSGTSLPDDTQATTPPSLGIAGLEQSSKGYGTTWGTAPWLGESTVLSGGAGGSSASSTTNPGAGSSDSGFNQISATGSGGSVTYNANNDWVNAPYSTVLPGDDCHYNLLLDQTGSGPFADGTLNVVAAFNQPMTGACGYANIGAGFVLSSVLNTTSTKVASSWAMLAGDTSALSAVPGLYGGPSSAGVLSLSPATAGTQKYSKSLTAKLAGYYPLAFTNTSAVDCLLQFTVADGPVTPGKGSGNFSTVCPIQQGPALPTPADPSDQPVLESPVGYPPTFTPSPGGPGYHTAGTPMYAYIDAGGLVADVPGFDVYPGYSTADLATGAILLNCSAQAGTSPNTITVTALNCPALNNVVITVKNH